MAEKNFLKKVDDVKQSNISVRWVVTQKRKERRDVFKARLVARGFEKTLEDCRTNSYTCAKDTLHFALLANSMNGWSCNSLDINAAFMQGYSLRKSVRLAIFLQKKKEKEEKQRQFLNPCSIPNKTTKDDFSFST